MISINYIAGLFDGEGTMYLTVTKQYYKGREYPRTSIIPQLAITNNCRGVLTEVQRRFGGKVGLATQKKGYHPTYRWYICSRREIMKFLEAVNPRLRIKQQEATLLLRYIKVRQQRPYKRKPLPEERALVMRFLKAKHKYTSRQVSPNYLDLVSRHFTV